MKEYIKLILVELVITLISIIGLVRFIVIDNDPSLHLLVLAGIGLSITYLVVRIFAKVRNYRSKLEIKEIVLNKLRDTATSIKFYTRLIMINHDKKVDIFNKGVEHYKSEDNVNRFFNSDLRNPDPRGGTSMGNMAEQIGKGFPKIISDLDLTISKYASITGHFKELQSYENLCRNEVFKSLINVKNWYDQNYSFQSRLKGKLPAGGMTITIGMIHDDRSLVVFNQFIDLVFELESCK